MAKRVIYNGGTQSYKGCSDPSVLEEGKVYEVIREDDRGFQTDYTLRGIKGTFNSVWFNEAFPKTYLAISRNIPIKGKQMLDFERFEKGKGWVKIKNTSVIQEISKVGIDMYKVHTQNTTYMVQIL